MTASLPGTEPASVEAAPVVPIDGVASRKVLLRRRMRMVRDLIDDRVLRSVTLWAAVAALDEYPAARRVMAFAGAEGEPDTDALFARLAHDRKLLVLPSVERGEIVPRLVGDGLVAGRYGILSPQGDEVDIADIDLVLVPGLAFTAEGARLGRGGGYYDRFLSRLAATCTTVGVCFAEQVVDELPSEPHDVNVRRVVVDALPVDFLSG